MKSLKSVLVAGCLLAFSSSGFAGPDEIPARPKFHPRFAFLAKSDELKESERLDISNSLYEVDDTLAKMKSQGGFYLSASSLSPRSNRFRGNENGAIFEGFYKLESAPLFVQALTGISDESARRAAFGQATKNFSELLIDFMEIYRLQPDWNAKVHDRDDVNFLLRHGQEKRESSYQFSMETNAFGFLKEFNKSLLSVGAISSSLNLVDYWTAVADSKNMKFSPLVSITVAEMRKSILENSLKNGLDVRAIRAGVAALKHLDLPMRSVEGWQFSAGYESDTWIEPSRQIWRGTSIERLVALRLEIVAALEQAKNQIEQGVGSMAATDRAEARRIFAREYSISDAERRLIKHSKLDFALKSVSGRICREMFVSTFAN